MPYVIRCVTTGDVHGVPRCSGGRRRRRAHHVQRADEDHRQTIEAGVFRSCTDCRAGHRGAKATDGSWGVILTTRRYPEEDACLSDEGGRDSAERPVIPDGPDSLCEAGVVARFQHIAGNTQVEAVDDILGFV